MDKSQNQVKTGHHQILNPIHVEVSHGKRQNVETRSAETRRVSRGYVERSISIAQKHRTGIHHDKIRETVVIEIGHGKGPVGAIKMFLPGVPPTLRLTESGTSRLRFQAGSRCCLQQGWSLQGLDCYRR